MNVAMLVGLCGKHLLFLTHFNQKYIKSTNFSKQYHKKKFMKIHAAFEVNMTDRHADIVS
jgi:hypothetical protein